MKMRRVVAALLVSLSVIAVVLHNVHISWQARGVTESQVKYRLYHEVNQQQQTLKTSSLANAAMFNGQSLASKSSNTAGSSNQNNQGLTAGEIKELVSSLPAEVVGLMDTSVHPCDDFYDFACGNYVKHAKIPESEVSKTWTWSTVDEKVINALHRTLQQDSGKAGTYFKACMDLELINKRGAEPIKEWTGNIPLVLDGSKAGLSKVLALFQSAEVTAFFKMKSRADDKTDKNVLQLTEDPVILPKPGYYVDNSASNNKTIKAYLKIGTEMLKLAGVQNPEQTMNDCFEMETHFAKTELFSDSIMCSEKHMTFEELKHAVPALDWDVYWSTLLNTTHIEESTLPRGNVTFLSYCPQYIQYMIDYAIKHPRQALAYFTWHIMYNASPITDRQLHHLSKKMVGLFTGATVEQPRWRKCVRSAGAALTMETARLYINQSLSMATLNDAEQMVTEIHHSFTDILKHTAWMDNQTIMAAVDKMHHMRLEVGLPSDGQALKRYKFPVYADRYFENAMNSSVSSVHDMLMHLTEPINRRRWEMSPCEANAYYDVTLNALFIPAAMLNEPFFSAQASPMRNYASLGWIIGHETTHGFDNSGRKYNSQGRKRNWWTDSDLKGFTRRAECVASKYSQFHVHGHRVHGNMTEGEDIADIGGLHAAWDAYQKYYAKENGGSPVPPVGGRGFFVSAAQNWCGKTRKKSQALSMETDVHAPDKVRVNAGMGQLPDVARLFSCPAHAPLNPSDRCGMWS